MSTPRLKATFSQPDSERAMFPSDFHVPFHDPVAVELTIAFMRWFKPDSVFLVGDVCDFYALSRFDKDPQRVLSLQQELDECKKLIGRIRSAAKKARIVYMDGNHEHRLIRFLWQNPNISTLNNLKLPSLLSLDDFGVEHHDYGVQLSWHGLLLEHGDRVRGKSAATACAMLEARGVCGVSGHTHRQGAYYRTDNAGVKVWFENGCLCSTSPSYIIGRPNWQQGFTVAYALSGKGRFHAEQIPILSGRLFYSGRMWEAT